MTRTTRLNSRIIPVLIVVACVLLAGCSSWGGDGPADDEEIEEDESDDLEEADGEADDEPDEADEDGIDDETDDADDENGIDEEEEVDEEYASPDNIEVEGVTHMEEAGTNHDEITVTNTHDELTLSINGWEIEMDGQDERVTIDNDAVIEPSESYTIEFEDGEKMLNEDGGVIDLYDAEDNHIGSWDHIGSPSAPAEESEEDETGYIQFTIEDAETEEGVDGANVALAGNENETDGAGVTTVQDVPYGEHELTVTHEEYTEHTETITVDEEEAAMAIELEPDGEPATQIGVITSISIVSV
jgi:hypothetical protein